MIDPVVVALWAVRSVHYAAIVVLLGAGSFNLYADIGSISHKLRGDFVRWLRSVIILSATVAFGSSVLWLVVQAAAMGGSWTSALDFETLQTVVVQTEFGRVWTIRSAIMVGLLIVVVLSDRQAGTKGELVVSALALVVVTTLAGTGHALIREGNARIVDISLHALHLVAASIWLGGLLPLGYILYKARQRWEPSWLAAAAFALPRFSFLGVVAVLTLAVTGVGISLSMIGQTSDLYLTAYGRILIAKVGLFLIMAALAVINRFGLMPDFIDRRSERRGTLLARNVNLEMGIGVAVLAMVGVLGTLSPESHKANGQAKELDQVLVADAGVARHQWSGTFKE